MSTRSVVYTKISDKLPKLAKSSAITSISPLVSFELENGKFVNGYAQRYDVGVNAHHMQAKKGDVVFFDIENTKIEKVAGWAAL